MNIKFENRNVKDCESNWDAFSAIHSNFKNLTDSSNDKSEMGIYFYINTKLHFDLNQIPFNMFRLKLVCKTKCIDVAQATNSWQETLHENIFRYNKYEASFRWILNCRKYLETRIKIYGFFVV